MSKPRMTTPAVLELNRETIQDLTASEAEDARGGRRLGCQGSGDPGCPHYTRGCPKETGAIKCAKTKFI